MLYPAHDEKLGDLLKGGVVSVLSARDPVYEPGFEGFFKNTSSVGIPLIHHGSVLAMAWSSVYDPERPFDEGAVEARTPPKSRVPRALPSASSRSLPS